MKVLSEFNISGLMRTKRKVIYFSVARTNVVLSGIFCGLFACTRQSLRDFYNCTYRYDFSVKNSTMH